MNKRLIAVIIIGVIVIVGLFVFVSQKSKPPVIVTPPPAKEIVPPPATGNVDDLVDALLTEITDEESVLKEEEGNASLITSDSQEIGSFSNSINESEL
jgi:hypothetical protein